MMTNQELLQSCLSQLDRADTQLCQLDRKIAETRERVLAGLKGISNQINGYLEDLREPQSGGHTNLQ